MTRQAKLQIGLDIKPLRDSTREAKRAIEDIGKIKLDKGLRTQLKDMFGKQLLDDAKKYQMQIQSINAEMRSLSKVEAFNPRQLTGYIKNLADLNRGLADTERLQKSLKSGSAGSSGPSLMSKGRGMLSTATSSLGMLGVGVGAYASVQRSAELARGSMAIGQIAGGTVKDRSKLGFTMDERQERAKGIASQAGRFMSDREVSKEVDRSETLERSFGVSGEAYGSAFGAAKKTGEGNEGQLISGIIGDAVALKLEGSSIGGYLESMTSYMESVSKGVRIDTPSLRGFAGILGQMDFFKKDPSRIGNTIGTLENVYQGGNEFQQYSAYKSTQEASQEINGRGLTASGVGVRQMLGLFGAGNKGEAKKLRDAGMGDLADIESIGGDAIMKSNLEEQFRLSTEGSGGYGEGKDNQRSAEAFMRNTGLKDRAGFETFTDMAKNKGKLSAKGLESGKKAAMSPEDRAEDNMSKFDGAVLRLDERLKSLQDSIAKFITDGVNKFVSAADEFSNLTGLFKSDIEKLGVLAAGIIAAKVAMGGSGLGGGGGDGGFFGGGGSGGKSPGVGMSILGGLSALAFGVEVGTGMRSILDEWTEGGFSAGVQKFWESAGEHLGMDFGGETANKRREEKDAKEKEFDAPGLTSALKKRNREVTPEAIEDMVSIREELRNKNTKEDQASARRLLLEEGKRSSALSDDYKGQMPSEDAVLDAYEKKKDGYSSGGFINYATGGTVGYSGGGKAIGTDTVNAKLTPGEFVVNARSTSQNTMALVHANAGGKIRAMSDGGVYGGEAGAMPDMPGFDTGGLAEALGSNTGATSVLTKVLLALAQGGMVGSTSLKQPPRGSHMRFGRG